MLAEQQRVSQARSDRWGTYFVYMPRLSPIGLNELCEFDARHIATVQIVLDLLEDG